MHLRTFIDKLLGRDRLQALLSSERNHNAFLRERIDKYEDAEQEANEAFNDLADRYEQVLLSLKDSEKSVGVLEGRASQLESENLRLTRMLEDSVNRERQLSDRMQKRMGLISETDRSTSVPTPVRTNRGSWSRTAAQLESQEKEQYYKNLIVEVEGRGKDSNNSRDVGVGRESTNEGLVGAEESVPSVSGTVPDNALSTGSAV